MTITSIESNSAGETGDQFPNNHQALVMASCNQNDYFGDKSAEGGSYVPSQSAQIGCSEWPMNATFAAGSFMNAMPYSFSESQSDGDITPSGSGSGIDGAARWN